MADEVKAGARHSSKDQAMLQTIHDHAVSLGAMCADEMAAEAPTKRDFSPKERQHMADTGAAMEDGSFPIMTEEDLRNAIQAYGRAKDPAAAKRHIIARARALGLTRLLPEDWKMMVGEETETFVAFGGAVKALGEGRVGGFGVQFTDETSQDLTGEHFTAKTYLGRQDGDGADTYFHHAQPIKDMYALADVTFAPAKVTRQDLGVWVETVLNLADEYEKTIYELVEAGKLGWSSGAPGHLVRKSANGEITRWPVAEWSLTPTPAEPRNRVVSLKALGATPLSAENGGRLGAAQVEDIPEEKTMGDEVKAGAAPEVVTTQGAGVDVAALAEAISAKVWEQVQAKLEAEPPTTKEAGFWAPAVHVTRREQAMDETQAFKLWMAWGNEAPPAVLNFMRRRYSKLAGFDLSGDVVKATLAEGTDAQGGYWVPTVYSDALNVPLVNQSYLRRAGANVMNGISGTDSFRVPSLTFSGRASIGGEGSAYTPDEPTAGEIEFNPYKLKKLAKATEEMVQDSRYDVWTMILQPDFAQSFAEGENYYFTNGTGSSQPQGVVYGATVGVTAASQTAITADEIKNLIYSVDYKYREDPSCGFMVNDNTALYIDKLKDGDGNYIWRESNQAGVPPRLWGYPVYTNNQMSTIATGNDTVLFGAFRYYNIAEWPGLQIQRLNELYAETGHVGFRAFRRIDANIMQAAAFRKLRQA